MTRPLFALVARPATAGVWPSDPDELRLQKAMVSLTAALISLMGFIWAAMYAALSLYRGAATLFCYAAIFSATLPLATATH